MGGTGDGDKVVDTTSHEDESNRNDSDPNKSEDETAGDRNDSDDDKSEDETAGNESDDEYRSDYSYSRSEGLPRKDDDESGRSDNELVGSSRNSEGGYDSVDDLLDSVEESVEEESDSQLPPESSPRPWGYDPLDLPRSNSSSRSLFWSNIDIEESPRSENFLT